MNTPFVGSIWWVTVFSIYELQIKNLTESPIIRKVAIRGGKQTPLKVPVGGRFYGKFYVAITAKGMYRYSMYRHQRELLPYPPKRIEQVGKKQRGMRARSAIGIFLKYSRAEECFLEDTGVPFDPRWHDDTLEAVLAIGWDHPLVTVSTERDWAVPEYLRNIPAVH